MQGKTSYGQSEIFLSPNNCFVSVFLSRWEENPSRSGFERENEKRVCSSLAMFHEKQCFTGFLVSLFWRKLMQSPTWMYDYLTSGLPISHLWPEYPGIQWQTYGPMHLPSFKHETRQRFFSHRDPINPCGQRHLSGPTHFPPYLQGGRHTGDRHAGPSNPSRHLQTFGFTQVPPL